MHGFESRMERLELKYAIDEATAARVVRDIEPWCLPDEYNFGRRGWGPGDRPGYEIQSLYLDTPSLAFHQAKERGDPERIKLRLRSYGASHTRILEMKERALDIIHKTRAVIEADALEDAALGYAKLRQDSPQARDFVDRFAGVVLATGAEPVQLVRYTREAYHSRTGDYARVTFDRDIAFQRVGDWTMEGRADGWAHLDHHAARSAPHPLVVLELKCETAVPHWILDLVRSHDLQRRSFSKYSIGIHLTNWLGGAPAGGRALRGVLL